MCTLLCVHAAGSDRVLVHGFRCLYLLVLVLCSRSSSATRTEDEAPADTSRLAERPRAMATMSGNVSVLCPYSHKPENNTHQKRELGALSSDPRVCDRRVVCTLTGELILSGITNESKRQRRGKLQQATPPPQPSPPPPTAFFLLSCNEFHKPPCTEISATVQLFYAPLSVVLASRAKK